MVTGLSKHGTSSMSICVSCCIVIEAWPHDSVWKCGCAQFWFIEILLKLFAVIKHLKKAPSMVNIKNFSLSHGMLLCFFVNWYIDGGFWKALCMTLKPYLTSWGGRLYTSIYMGTEPWKQPFINPNKKFCVVVWLLILLPSADKSCRRFQYSAVCSTELNKNHFNFSFSKIYFWRLNVYQYNWYLKPSVW
jgi:hypothetical protein